MENITDPTYSAYFWVNSLYMNEKQFGIQTAHCVSDMSLMEFGKDVYREWAENHKTIMMFAGTNSGTIKRTYEVLQYVQRNLKHVGIEIPTVIFREDQESLDGAVTACGFVIPNNLRSFGWDAYTSWEGDNPLDLFLPDLRSGDTLKEPWEVTTKSWLEFIHTKDALHKAFHELRSYNPNYSNYEDYEHDDFMLAEFADWMNRQRLA